MILLFFFFLWWAQDIVTAVCYSPDGLYVVAGLIDGQVFIYESTDLKYYTQIACIRKNKKLKSSHDKRKVTGVSFIYSEKNTTSNNNPIRKKTVLTKDNYKLLVTTNDSRIRIFSMTDFTLIIKLKGHLNRSRQIKGTSSSDGNNVICGSDTGEVFIWKVCLQSDDQLHQNRISNASTNDSHGYDKITTSMASTSTTVATTTNTTTAITKMSSNPSDIIPSRSTSLSSVLVPCTTAIFIPSESINRALKIRKKKTQPMNEINRLDEGNVIAILTAEYDGSIHVLFVECDSQTISSPKSSSSS